MFRNAPKARFEMDLEVTGQVKDLCDSSGTTMSAMRLAYNGHRHSTARFFRFRNHAFEIDIQQTIYQVSTTNMNVLS